MAKTASKSMYNWQRYPSSNWYKNWLKIAVLNFVPCCGAIWRRREKLQYRFTTTIHHVHNTPKDVSENFLPVWLLVRTNFFIPSRRYTAKKRFSIWRLSTILDLLRRHQSYCIRVLYMFLTVCWIFISTGSVLSDIYLDFHASEFWLEIAYLGPNF